MRRYAALFDYTTNTYAVIFHDDYNGYWNVYHSNFDDMDKAKEIAEALAKMDQDEA